MILLSSNGAGSILLLVGYIAILQLLCILQQSDHRRNSRRNSRK